MPTVESVGIWIAANVLDSEAWDNSTKKELAVIQASRNLSRWYPSVLITDELVAYQSIWELQGLDPALKYQKQGVKAVTESGERIDYGARSRVAPEIVEAYGPPLYELIPDEPPEEEAPLQFGGIII